MKDTLGLPWDESVDERWRTLSIGEGWLPIVERLDRDLRAIYPDYRVQQVKEKFGGLRFYARTSGDGELFQARIREAEAEAKRTCEVCGASGTNRVNPRGWWRTVCNEHAQERTS